MVVLPKVISDKKFCLGHWASGYRDTRHEQRCAVSARSPTQLVASVFMLNSMEVYLLAVSAHKLM